MSEQLPRLRNQPANVSNTQSRAPAELNAWRSAMQDPTHSHRYAQRWEQLEAEGFDIHGEARALDAMAQRGSTILDAGCGNGRVARYLADRGHHVMGMDLDPHLIDVAAQHNSTAQFVVGDLADFALLDDDGVVQQFDFIVSAGNVQAFLADWERVPALKNIAAHMHGDSKFITGYQLARGYSDEQFTADAHAAELTVTQRFATWQFDPFNSSSDFLLAVAQKHG